MSFNQLSLSLVSIILPLIIHSLPNIIFILLDDIGINDVGWQQQNTDIQTPFLDELAWKESLILTNYYAQQICSASRAALLTGRYPANVGLQQDALSPFATCSLTRQVSILSNEFQSQGYSTHLIGKWHQGYQSWEYTPLYRGFDTFFGYFTGAIDYYTHKILLLSSTEISEPVPRDLHRNEEPSNEYVGIYSMEWHKQEMFALLETKINSDQPFFIYFSVQASHTPTQAPDDYVKIYEGGQNTGDDGRITFKAQTTCMDDMMKDVITYIKHVNLWHNSLIIISSDNGGEYHLGDNAPFRGFKQTFWEGGVKVPAFITGGILNDERRGQSLDYLIHITDWYKTLLSAAGLQVTYARSQRLYGTDEIDDRWDSTPNIELDGVDLWQYIEGNKKDDEYFHNQREFLVDLKEDHCDFKSCGALRIGRYKYLRGDTCSRPIRGDNDGDKWFRDFALNPDVADIECTKHSDQFKYFHGLNENEEFDINSLKCVYNKRGCLFDLKLDPCEYYDLSQMKPNLVEQFQIKLNEYQTNAQRPLMDMADDPLMSKLAECKDFVCPFMRYNDVFFEYKLYQNIKREL